VIFHQIIETGSRINPIIQFELSFFFLTISIFTLFLLPFYLLDTALYLVIHFIITYFYLQPFKSFFFIFIFSIG